MRDIKDYDALVVITPSDFERVSLLFKRIKNLLPVRRIKVIGSDGVKKILDGLMYEDVDFINENDLISFDSVSGYMSNVMKEYLDEKSIPRGFVGWYYQQFLKMKYSSICEDEYYLTWDGDTVPCKEFTMFSSAVVPYFDLKTEFHEEYFDTISKLFPGLGKVIEKSFISEHMLFKSSIMKKMIDDIEANDSIEGNLFYEKIISAIGSYNLENTAFSEFETYGTYVATRYPMEYKLRNWHSIRYGSVYFKSEDLTDEDFRWLGNDFDAVSFEKNQDFIPEINAIFMNADYRNKLTPRQIVEIIQDSSSEGMKEVWDEPEKKDVVDKDHDENEYLIFNYLGDSIVKENIDQAYLCYENAAFLCPFEDIKVALDKKKKELRDTGKVTVQKTSIIILTYNEVYFTSNCLNSIRKYCSPEAYNIVVVDNASTDETVGYLKKQSDIKLILNDLNIGFPAGCNIGISKSDANDDIFLLNNDTRMTHNALFWLRMGLYESKHVGATGAVSNYCGVEQQVDISFSLPEEYVEYARNINVLVKQPYEEKNILCGFAMLINRKVFDKIGVLDENFSPGYFEDDDLSLRIKESGYKLLLCHNSFIYHAGSQSFIKRDDLKIIAEKNHLYLTEKWGYDSLSYSTITKEESAIELSFTHKSDDFFRVLEINSGSGSMLSRIKYHYSQAAVYGIEENDLAVKNGIESIPLLLLDWKKDVIPFPEKYFDYIIYNSRQEEFIDKELVIQKVGNFIKDDGELLFT